MKQRLSLAFVLAIVALGSWFAIRTERRTDANEALAKEAVQQVRQDRITIPDADGGVRVFLRADGESATDWAHRVREIYAAAGTANFPPPNYICEDLHGCDTATGNMTLCIFIPPGMSQEEARERLEEALFAFCQEFHCDGCG